MTGPGDNISIGELGRRLDAMERRMDLGFQTMNRSIVELQFVHLDRYEADHRTVDTRFAAIERRVDELEDSAKWTWRTLAATIIGVIGSVVAAVVLARGGV